MIRKSAKDSPWLVLLSGASSSGKTTLAKALAKHSLECKRPFLHIDSDQFVPNCPFSREDSHAKRASFNRAICNSVLAFADQGFDLVIDGILPYGEPELLANTLETFQRYALCYVGVHCNLHVLEQRESLRKNRTQGWARKQFNDLHQGQKYTLEVDTSMSETQEIVNTIWSYMFIRNPYTS